MFLPLDWLAEHTPLEFVRCVTPGGYTWVEVVYNGATGYVYSDYTDPPVCK